MWRPMVVLAAVVGCRIDFDPLPDAGAAWGDPQRGFRKALVVDHARVAGDLVDFPVLVALDDADLAAHARSDGADVVFTDTSGQPLARELDVYAAGSLRAWVKLPSLASAADTTFYMYYGGAASTQDPRAVWTNHFASVYHFGDGTTIDVHDSTGNNDGVANSATGIAGQIGGGAHYTGVSGTTAGTSQVDQTAGGYNTVSYWVDYAPPFAKGPFVFAGTSGAVYDTWFYADGCFGFNTGAGEVLGTTLTGLAARWVYVAAVFYNGVPDAAHNHFYIDGAEQTLTMCAGGNAVAASPGTTVYWGGNSGYYMTGAVDEGRIASIARDPAWIATESANQHDPGGFVRAGVEQAR